MIRSRQPAGMIWCRHGVWAQHFQRAATSGLVVRGVIVVFDKFMFRFRNYLTVMALLAALTPARAAETTIAVAANFATAATDIVNLFEAESEHRVILVIGSTGKLAAQILHGAPYDALLAADRERPKLLERKGLAVAGSRFSYARGRLVLMASPPVVLNGGLRTGLLDPKVRHLAIANEKLAPYGRAARQVLDRTGLAEQLGPMVIVGESVGQTAGLVSSGNAQIGLVAYSQMLDLDASKRPAFIEVPLELYDPILQDAVLLARAENNPAATNFIAFMKTPKIRQAIRDNGYGEVE